MGFARLEHHGATGGRGRLDGWSSVAGTFHDMTLAVTPIDCLLIRSTADECEDFGSSHAAEKLVST